MEKIDIDVSKLYYGFPVYFLGYKDENHKYNFSTMSSSYTLGDMVVVGVAKNKNAIVQIRKYKCFTINLPDRSLLEEVKIGAVNSGEDKFEISDKLTFTVSSKIDAPIIDNCFLSIECEAIDFHLFDNFCNIIAKVKGRMIDESLFLNNQVNRKDFNPIIFMGDGTMRSYRFLNDESIDVR